MQISFMDLQQVDLQKSNRNMTLDSVKRIGFELIFQECDIFFCLSAWLHFICMPPPMQDHARNESMQAAGSLQHIC